MLCFSGELNSTKLSKRPFWFMGDNFGSRDFFAKKIDFWTQSNDPRPYSRFQGSKVKET